MFGRGEEWGAEEGKYCLPHKGRGVGQQEAGTKAAGEGGSVGLAEETQEIRGDVHDVRPQTRTEVQRNIVIPQRIFGGGANIRLGVSLREFPFLFCLRGGGRHTHALRFVLPWF